MSWPYGVVSLVVRGQRVYVVHESSDHSKPILFRDHWPTIHSVHELPTDWETRYKSLESQGGGSAGYTFWYEGNGFGNYMSIVLMFGGQTESIKRDVLEILPPKTKQETRYRDGRWQRYRKSDKRGWIDCHPWQVAQPLERVGPAIHPIGERITFETTDVCLVYQDSLVKDPNHIARLMYDNLDLQIAKGFSEQLVDYIKKDAAQYGKGDVIEIPQRNMQVILGKSLK
jgi:hypothetical protein